MLKNFSLQERSWILYDWANSAHSAVITAAVLPLFYKAMTKDAGIASNVADSYWGYATSAGTLIIALMMPLLGTIGDYRGVRMRLFRLFFLIGVIATAGLALAPSWSSLLAIYMLTLLGFSGANLYYDASLVDVTTPERMDRVSTFGFGFGYIGGSTIPLIISIALIMLGPKVGISSDLAVRISFLLVAAWWAVFTIPMLRNVKQKYSVEPDAHPIRSSLARLAKTIRNIASYRNIFIFLLAYFFYIDGVGTIIHMATVYGDSVGISANMLLAALLFIQIVAFPFAILYGKLAERVGAYRMILVGIVIYIIVCILGYRMKSALDFWVLGFLVATSQGGIQALSRSFFGKLVPKDNANEFFGFYDIFGKFAAILGPTLFGISSQLTGESRFGVLSVIVLFIIGGLIFLFGVKPEQRKAGAATS